MFLRLIKQSNKPKKSVNNVEESNSNISSNQEGQTFRSAEGTVSKLVPVQKNNAPNTSDNNVASMTHPGLAHANTDAHQT